jgi:hypothetical protein
LLIESFLQAFIFRAFSCRADNAIYLIGLQWTKASDGATLHCNVDRFGAGSLTVELHRRTPHPSPHQEE